LAHTEDAPVNSRRRCFSSALSYVFNSTVTVSTAKLSVKLGYTVNIRSTVDRDILVGTHGADRAVVHAIDMINILCSVRQQQIC